jgi:hypothetical protein
MRAREGLSVGNRARFGLGASIAGLLLVLAIGGYLFWSSTSPSSSPGQFSLTVVNIDGPPVDVKINGVVVAHVVCHGGANPAMTPSASLPLPWVVTVTKADGTVLGTWTEAGNNGGRKIEIRAGYVDEVAEELGGGPMPGPCAS